MTKFEGLFLRFIHDENGATAIEYGLIAALIGVGIIIGARSMSGSISGMFTNVDNDLGKSFAPVPTPE